MEAPGELQPTKYSTGVNLDVFLIMADVICLGFSKGIIFLL
jgi:hypothetical protein